MTQTLSGEFAEGQRKLLALASSKATNPIVSQLSNGPMLQIEKVIFVFLLISIFLLCSKYRIPLNMSSFVHAKQTRSFGNSLRHPLIQPKSYLDC